MSPTSFEIIAQTHARVPQSISKWMFDHIEEVGLSKTLENIVELERPTFSEIIARLLVGWLLYSFLTQIFLLWVVIEKEYMKHDIRKIMNIVSWICLEIIVGTQA